MPTRYLISFLKKVKHWFNRLLHKIDLKLMPMFALNGLLASIYYTVINRSFYREHIGVLRGRLSYFKSLDEFNDSSVLLRRNIHRLEKGLIMRPRRTVFAQSYIVETVVCYARCVQSGSVDNDEIVWARDVLSEYFVAVSGAGRTIVQAQRQFESVSSVSTVCNVTDSSVWAKPYAHAALPPSTIDYAALFTLFKRRRSVRWYQDKTVSPELIEQAVNAASLAPSACNRQPYRFELFNGVEQAAKVAELAMGTAGFSAQLPCVMVVVGDLSCYPKERDRHVIYIDAALASMQLMLALETLGLSSCPINWPDIEARERKMAKRLGLQSFERVVMLIALGFAEPDVGIPYSQKKSAGHLLKSNDLEPDCCEPVL